MDLLEQSTASILWIHVQVVWHQRLQKISPTSKESFCLCYMVIPGFRRPAASLQSGHSNGRKQEHRLYLTVREISDRFYPSYTSSITKLFFRRKLSLYECCQCRNSQYKLNIWNKYRLDQNWVISPFTSTDKIIQDTFKCRFMQLQKNKTCKEGFSSTSSN